MEENQFLINPEQRRKMCLYAGACVLNGEKGNITRVSVSLDEGTFLICSEKYGEFKVFMKDPDEHFMLYYNLMVRKINECYCIDIPEIEKSYKLNVVEGDWL